MIRPTSLLLEHSIRTKQGLSELHGRILRRCVYDEPANLKAANKLHYLKQLGEQSDFIGGLVTHCAELRLAGCLALYIRF